MESLKNIKRTLTSIVEGQMANIAEVDAKELGEAIDMIKDLEEAIYYCTIVKAMEEGSNETYYYTEPYRMPRGMGGNSNASSGNSSGFNGNSSGSRYYHEREYYPEEEMRDYREGRSPMSRRMYMESKEMHHPKEKKMKELEQYMKELSTDITEMIEDASPEERQMLQTKLATLATKVTKNG